MLAAMLRPSANLWFYQQLMQGLRDVIGDGRLEAFVAEFRRGTLGAGDGGGCRLPDVMVVAATDQSRSFISTAANVCC